ncbi:WRKY transcription factor 1 isoform X2 [Cucumis melo]|uniref:WRKY transcription factor 1 isoform X2 n=1 Tax=Cucumis melo TaxID=3656 RepID=A0A1S3CGN7_CUCME|nr:WRKY transcription factor 1 isoform X2 [Cucumis melo]XP_050941379.1 WRKY transcription factor 1 isoform X2 [Cucumis melo]
MVSTGDQLENGVDSDQLDHENSSDSQPQASQDDPGGTNASKSDHKCTGASSNTLEEAVKQPEVTIALVDRGDISNIVTEKVTHKPITAEQNPLSVLKVCITSSIREKVSEDGYNWRKYGQKLVKGNVFVRSYYRCTHPTCMVKKQLERTHDGKITDTVYFGQHDHPKPQPHIPIPVGVVTMVEEKLGEHASGNSQDKTSTTLSPTPQQTELTDMRQPPSVIASDNVKDEASKRSRTNDEASKRSRTIDEIDSDDTPDLKREKKRCNIDVTTVADKSIVESRVVVQTPSEVDIVNDGYRWRKYGQKFVKGNPNPRSYYRCSSPGCPVKKHVERASHDPKVVLTTYEGQHDHVLPPIRTVTLNSVGSTTAHSDETKPKPVSTVVHASKDPQSDSSSEGKLIEENGKLNATETSDDIILDGVVVNPSPGVASEQNKQLKVAIES